ncbi:hypothetical protein CC79DRAFT_1365904 [Sarocladium strictum]
MAPLPKVDTSVIRELQKLSKLPLGSQETKSSQKPRPRDDALDRFLNQLRSTRAEQRRPFLVNLSGGGAILIALPRPIEEAETVHKAFFYFITDPWLSGPAHVFGFPDLLLTLRHPEVEAYRSIAAVELLIRAFETAALDSTNDDWHFGNKSEPRGQVRPGIDAFIIHNQVEDHAHPQTLMLTDPDTPVLAAEPAVHVIRSWKHFTNIWAIPNSNIGSKTPLPRWIGVMRLPTAEASPNDLHGTLISWASKFSGRPEGLLFAPHGIALETVENVLVGAPVLKMLALLHPVNETEPQGDQGGNLGVDSGLEVYRAIEAKYWVQIDDGDLERTGLVAPLLEFRERSLEEALEANPGPRPSFRARANGDIFVLT